MSFKTRRSTRLVNAALDDSYPVPLIATTGNDADRAFPRDDEQAEFQEGLWPIGVRVTALGVLWLLLSLVCFPIATTGRDPIDAIQAAVFDPQLLNEFQPRLRWNIEVNMLAAPFLMSVSSFPATLMVLAVCQWMTNRRHFKLLFVVTLAWHCLLTQLLLLMFGYAFKSESKNFMFSGGALAGPLSFPIIFAYSSTSLLGLAFHEQQLAGLPNEALGRFRKTIPDTPVSAARIRWMVITGCTLASCLLMPLNGPATLLLHMRAWIWLEADLKSSLLIMARYATHGVGGYPLYAILCAAPPAILALYCQRKALRYSRTAGNTLGTLVGWMVGVVGLWLVALSLVSFTHQMQGVRPDWKGVHHATIWLVFSFLCAGYLVCSTVALTLDLPPALRGKSRHN